MCVSVPIKAILHQPRTLPLARYVILSWVEPFLYASERGCWTRLVKTHREVWLREARCYKRCSRSFLSPIFSLSSDKKFDLDICRGLHGLGEYGFASAPARSWDCGARCFVRRSVLGLDEAEACFEGSMTGEACRGMVPAKCHAVHSGEFADSPRQGRL